MGDVAHLVRRKISLPKNQKFAFGLCQTNNFQVFLALVLKCINLFFNFYYAKWKTNIMKKLWIPCGNPVASSWSLKKDSGPSGDALIGSRIVISRSNIIYYKIFTSNFKCYCSAQLAIFLHFLDKFRNNFGSATFADFQNSYTNRFLIIYVTCNHKNFLRSRLGVTIFLIFVHHRKLWFIISPLKIVIYYESILRPLKAILSWNCLIRLAVTSTLS